MKKVIVFLILITFLLPLILYRVYAAENIIKPPSRFYFLQTWGEEIRLFFTRSPEKKIAYLTELTARRVEEMQEAPSPSVVNRYENHYRELGRLANEVENKDLASDKIKEASLTQQQALAEVYQQAPEPAQDAILKAQEHSSQHVTRAIEAIEGPEKAQEFAQQVAQIQQAARADQAEKAPMESGPNADPAESAPKELKGTNPLQEGQPLNQINTTDDAAKNSGGNRSEPVVPIQIESPAGQN
jgi:hypothetical protein